MNVQLTMNFSYELEVSFITQIYDEDGKVKASYVKSMLAKSMEMGDSVVSLNAALPEDFNKDKDTIKIFAVTRLSTDAVTEPDETMTVSKSANGIVTIDTLPTFDDGAKIMVTVLKATADETKVTESDVVYFDMTKDLENLVIKPMNTTEDLIVKVSGLVDGVLTIKSATTASN